MKVRRVVSIATSVFCILLLLYVTVFLIVRWNDIPKEIPIHYDGNGAISGYGSKSNLLLLAGLNWMILVVLVISERSGRTVRLNAFRLGRFSSRDLTQIAMEKEPVKSQQIMTEMLLILKTVVAVILSWLTVSAALVRPIGPYFLPLILTGTIVPTVVMIVRLAVIAKS